VTAGDDETMRAYIQERYVAPDALELRTVERPRVADDTVLVRVRATSVNPVDWYGIAGKPWVARPMTGLRRPKEPLVGTDFAGTVEAVGKDVAHVRPGDDVYGGKTGSFAEFVTVRDAVVRKPANLSFEEAAAVPVAGVTALQALRQHGRVQPGQKVLVNGASGGVGTFAVQVAKALGAEVTAVCSTGNCETVGSLGADRVVDYKREDFTRCGERFDLMLDVNGVGSWRRYRRVLRPDATLVIVGSGTRKPLLGPLGHIAALKLASIRSSRTVVFAIAKLTRDDLDFLRELIESGRVRPVIDRRYDELADVPAALGYLGEGHARGKIVVTV
jgi:NADPH:quinone reductase-like Zn-dependent oxidoreductase